MSEKTYLLKMEEKQKCALMSDELGYGICGHADAYYRVTFGYTCQGKLKNRPTWCPLVEQNEPWVQG